MSGRVLILLAFLGGALGASYSVGALGDVIERDQTGIVYGLIAAALICTALAQTRRRVLIWVLDHQIAPIVGLLGTVLGFMAALAGITGDVTAAKLSGVETALVTTAVGMVCHIWLLVVREATRE